jgi:hypothetical protein
MLTLVLCNMCYIKIFLGSVNRNCIFRMVFIIITYPLHVSAPTGHLQVEYVYIYIYIYIYLYTG